MSLKLLSKWLIVIISIILGGVFGYILGIKHGMNSGIFARDLTTLAWYSHFANNQAENADYEEGKKALLNYLEIIDNFKNSQDPMISKQILTFDKMLTYARLYKLELGNNNLEQSNIFLEKSKSECEKSSLKDCSILAIENYLNKIKNK